MFSPLILWRFYTLRESPLLKHLGAIRGVNLSPFLPTLFLSWQGGFLACPSGSVIWMSHDVAAAMHPRQPQCQKELNQVLEVTRGKLPFE
jgi:hypothetical protein